MKKDLRIVCILLAAVGFSFASIAVQAQTCEWRLSNAVFNPTDPDGIGPATGSVTFTLQIHATSTDITDVNVLATGWSYQSANAMIPTTQGCGVVSNPANVTVSNAFTTAGFTYQTVNQCGVFNQTAGGINFDRRAVGTLIGSAITLTNAWTDVFTVTLWTLGNVAPNGGYAVINSGSSGTNVPPGIVFTTYSVSDVEANEYGVNSLTYTTPLPLAVGALPVTFSKYELKCSDRGTVLSWATASESNSNYFEIQKSIPGSDWKNVGHIPAAGNSSSTKNYQYLDAEGGTALYRIKQVDNDGKNIFTDVKPGNCQSKTPGTVLIYPTPATDRITVVLKAERSVNTNLLILDAAGKVVQTTNTAIIAGNNNITLDVHRLASGQYILVSSDPSVYINKKIIIAR